MMSSDRLGQIVRSESILADLQLAAVHVVAVDSADVGDSVRSEGRQPSADPTPDIDDTRGLNQPQDERNNPFSRPARPSLLALVKLLCVTVRHHLRAGSSICIENKGLRSRPATVPELRPNPAR
jgi:hypothetical protein